MYRKNIENGHIISIVSGVANGNISKEEYNTILDVIRNKPSAPEGFDYKLKEDLTWEIFELPAPDPEDEDATVEDYEQGDLRCVDLESRKRQPSYFIRFALPE